MSHYFENDENLKSFKRSLKLYINNKELSFTSDSGVFSNTQIDYGSYTFLKTLLKEEKINDLLDVGCGYGVLGITLKYFENANNVDMVDINPKAVNLCLENINYYQMNNVKHFINYRFASSYWWINNYTIIFFINFFKKVFLDSDKVLTGEGKGK